MLTRNSSETIGDLSRDLPACSAESHPPTLVGVDGTFCVRSHLMTYIHTHTRTHAVGLLWTRELGNFVSINWYIFMGVAAKTVLFCLKVQFSSNAEQMMYGCALLVAAS